MSHKVSIVVPMFNAEKDIHRCVESLLCQTYQDIEIVLVDDGSTDNTVCLCREFENSNKSIRIIERNTNGGVSLARLKGAESCEGEYILFVDSDDWVEKDYVEDMVLNLDGGDIVASGISKEWEQPIPGNEEEYNKIEVGIYASKDERGQLYRQMLYFGYPFEFGVLPYMCNKIYRRSIILELLREIDKRIYDGEDVAIIYEYLLLAKKIIVTKSCKYHYCIHNDSAAFKDKEDAYANASYLYLYLYRSLKKYDQDYNIQLQIDNYMRFLIWKKDPAIYLLVNKNEFMFPYHLIPSEAAKIVVYGAGKMGVSYIHQIADKKMYQIVAWVDMKPSLYKNGDLEVMQFHPDMIRKLEYDYIIIALYDRKIRETVKEYLIGMGVENNKIVEPDGKEK